MTLLLGPRAWGEPPVTALLKQSPEDFEVEEILGFEPDGSGEHQFLWIEKAGLNTVDAAQRLAAFAGLRDADISWAGLKDRQALTRQWFSLHLPGREVDWSSWSDPTLRILRCERHSRKLRRGSHRGNRFAIVLHELQGDVAELQQQLQRIGIDGVPNYFGAQRFGRDGRNLVLAQRWAAQGAPRIKPAQRGLYLSVLRAYQEWIWRDLSQVVAARSTFSFGVPVLGASSEGLADDSFFAWLAQVQWARRWKLGGIQTVLRADAQLTNGALPALERFAVGGHASVRGNREYALVRDEGAVGSAEVRVPLWQSEGRPVIELAPFADVGWSSDRDRETESPDFLSLILFQPDYLTRLIEIGEADAEARGEEIAALVGDPGAPLTRS